MLPEYIEFSNRRKVTIRLTQALKASRAMAEKSNTIRAFLPGEQSHPSSAQTAGLTFVALLVLGSGFAGISPWQKVPTANPETIVENLALLKGGLKTSFAFRFPSPDCDGPTPKGYTRIFIGRRRDSRPGTGRASDPFDGGTAQTFDALLRARSEAGVTNLIVCIASGTFETEGTHDYQIGVGHLDKIQATGFTVGRGWRVHGAGMGRTILKLTDLYFDRAAGKYLIGQIIGTRDLDSYGVEVSDLTLDANYHTLKSQYKAGLQLQAIFLQSNRGQHWIHDIHVMNTAGEVAESFPVEIGSQSENPKESSGSIVERVTMDHWAGGKCTAIAIVNASAEVRFNTVFGYYGAYGGWKMSDSRFRDNSASETVYGFNIDSLDNSGVVIARNQIVHPLLYGLVIGGIGQFSNFSISDNVITMASTTRRDDRYGLLFQGNVSGARVTGNKIISEHLPVSAHIFGFYEKGAGNTGNLFQDNEAPSFFSNSLQKGECVYGNTSENGASLGGVRNSQSAKCTP
jgi:hypothetical protein